MKIERYMNNLNVLGYREERWGTNDEKYILLIIFDVKYVMFFAIDGRYDIFNEELRSRH